MRRSHGYDTSSTGTGVHSTFTDRSETIKPTNLTGGARLNFIESRVSSLLLAEQPEIIVVEGYSYGSKFYREQAGEVGGIVRYAIYRTGLWDQLRIATPQQVKQFATDKGGASKDDVKDAVRNRWHHPVADDNQADAYILALIGEYLLKDPHDWVDISVPQFHVLKAIRENPRGEMQRVVQARAKKGKRHEQAAGL